MSFHIQSAKLVSAPPKIGGSFIYEPQPRKSFLLIAAPQITSEAARSIYNSLIAKDSLNDIYHKFSQLFDDLALILVVFDQASVTLTSVGDFSAAILREGSLVKLVNPSVDLVSVSGNLLTGDTFLIADHKFSRLVPEGTKKASLQKSDLAQSSDEIARLISQEVSLTDYCVLLLRVGPELMGNTAVAVGNKNPGPVFGLKQNIIKLIDLLLNRLSPEKTIFVKPFSSEGFSKRRKVTTFVIGVILLILLVTSIFFGIRQKNYLGYKQELEQSIVVVNRDFDEAEKLSAINFALARKLLVEAQTKINSLENKYPNEQQVKDLRAKVLEKLQSQAGVYQSEAALFLDLSWITAGFKMTDLSMSEGTLTLLDTANTKLVTIDVETKKTKVQASSDTLPATLFKVASYSGRNFVSSSDGVYEIGTNAKKVVNKETTQENLIKVFGGNIYLVDKSSSEITRFAGLGGTFSEGQSWLAPGITGNFGNVLALNIDGNVWLLGSDGELKKYSQGVPQNFTLGELPDFANSLADFYTEEESQYLYLLDPANNRVLVVDKSGKYKAEYTSDKIKEGKRIVVSEENKKILIVTESKIYSLDIRH